MSNIYSINPIILDTFGTAIDLHANLVKTVYSVSSIEWQKPVTVGDTCTITDGDGNPIFDEYCTVAYESKIKYFEGTYFSNIKIAQNAVSSGKVIILLRFNRRI